MTEDRKQAKRLPMDSGKGQKESEKQASKNLLLRYLVERRMAAGIFLLCNLVFFVTCLLYQLENISKLLYAFFLCAFFFFCFAACDFFTYAKRSKGLSRASANIDNLLELLPAPNGLHEEQYRMIAETLLEERRRLLLESNLKKTDMSDYYTMWAHQIKTPIAAIKLLLQNNEGQQPTTDIMGNASMESQSSALSRELFKIEQYVEMVLYYLRLDSISADFLFREQELRSIVSQAIKKHAVLFINSKLSLDFRDFQYKVVTDEKWLQFAIEQILSNALKYTPRGRISIDAGATPEGVWLAIEDTGIGIRAEDLPRIFERGFTGYNGRLDKKSTGIGLYLTKQILDKLSLTVTVASEVGKGTRVTIGFPIASDYLASNDGPFHPSSLIR